MTLPEQVIALDEMGVDLAGFIFYPKSPRYAGQKISAEKMKQIKGHIAKVGVFVNMPYDDLMKTVEDYRLDMVQLHGDESPHFCEKVANYVTIVKAFRLSDNDPLDWIVRPFHEGSDMYMFDTLGAGYGGTGKKFDWNVLKNAAIDKLFFLSGGIEPGDEERWRCGLAVARTVRVRRQPRIGRRTRRVGARRQEASDLLGGERGRQRRRGRQALDRERRPRATERDSGNR